MQISHRLRIFFLKLKINPSTHTQGKLVEKKPYQSNFNKSRSKFLSSASWTLAICFFTIPFFYVLDFEICFYLFFWFSFLFSFFNHIFSLSTFVQSTWYIRNALVVNVCISKSVWWTLLIACTNVSLRLNVRRRESIQNVFSIFFRSVSHLTLLVGILFR